jgi:6,7-dimethyl-8-ribityllumazine synthase
MSGDGAPVLESVDGTHLRIGLVHAAWHEPVMAGLLAGARRALDETGVAEVVEVSVPGSFELPVAAARLAASGLDAVVTLGVVVRGGTPHFDYVCAATSHALAELSTRTGIPIGFGLLTCDTVEQALDRVGLPDSHEDKGYEAATAAVATAAALRGLPVPGSGAYV